MIQLNVIATRLMMVMITGIFLMSTVQVANMYLENDSWREKYNRDINELYDGVTLGDAKIEELNNDIDKYSKKVHDLEAENSYLREELEAGYEYNAMGFSTKPWQPQLSLSKSKEIACLSIALYTEEGMGTREDWIKVSNTIYNRAGKSRFKSNSCEVITSGFDGVKPYIAKVKEILKGNISSYTPKIVSENKMNRKRWEQINKIAKRIVDGKEPYLTDATHFVSIKGLVRIPSWLRKIRPVGATTGHLLFSDYEIREGKRIVYTAHRPYNQAAFNYQ